MSSVDITTTNNNNGGPAPDAAPVGWRKLILLPRYRMMIFAMIGVISMSLGRVLSGNDDLTSSGTFGVALRTAAPIALAGLAGLFAERSGTVNIGLEGMMILGTWFGAWGALAYGPWWGAVLGIVGGAIGGLVHAIATVTFGIDHIVSGVAINILAAGVARFLSVIAFTGAGGGANQSARIPESIPRVTLPVMAGGELFGRETPNLFGWLDGLPVPVVSEVGALGLALTSNVSWLLLISLALVPTVWFVLWRTTIGLRMRSVGEAPVAAESLGVNVYVMKYLGVTISGALAGLGGAILVLEAAGIYREGQTGGRGFIALAALIFGNWRPGGVLMGAALFGYASALELRSGESVHSLVLFVALVLAIYGTVRLLQDRRLPPVLPLVAGGGMLVLFMTSLAFEWRTAGSGRGLATWVLILAGVLAVDALVRQLQDRSLPGLYVLALAGLIGFAYLVTESVPSQFVFFTPHLTTLVVLAFFSQRLRPPAAVGRPYRRGQQL